MSNNHAVPFATVLDFCHDSDRYQSVMCTSGAMSMCGSTCACVGGAGAWVTNTATPPTSSYFWLPHCSIHGMLQCGSKERVPRQCCWSPNHCRALKCCQGYSHLGPSLLENALVCFSILQSDCILLDRYEIICKIMLSFALKANKSKQYLL